MTSKELVAKVREKFPSYTQSLDSACRYSFKTGVTRTRECEGVCREILGKQKRRKETTIGFHLRVPRDFPWEEYKELVGYSMNEHLMNFVRKDYDSRRINQESSRT